MKRFAERQTALLPSERLAQPTPLRTCNTCGLAQPLGGFYNEPNSSEGLRARCKNCCREASRKRYADNRDLYKAQVREYRKQKRASNPELWAYQNYLRQIRCKFGLSEEDLLHLLERQAGVCAICGGAPNGTGRFHVDHDHNTDRIRGLLCSNCNRGIGHLQDDPDLLVAAAEYLRAHCAEPPAPTSRRATA